MQNEKTRKLVESALLIAIATVLSVFKLAELPYGGSVTLASMLPLVLISYRHGLGWGVTSALAYGVLQQLLGLKNLTYFSTPLSIVAIILLDYLVAFGVAGLGGFLRRAKMKQSYALAIGSALVCVLRYGCHVVSGATVWAGLSIPDSAALIYSFIYNATYMLPETIVLVLAAYYLGSLIDFTTPLPTRLVRESTSTGGESPWLRYGAIGSIVAGAIYDVVAIFSKMQDPETGEFSVVYLADKWLWISVVVVTLVTVAIAIMFYVLGKKQAKPAEEA